MTRKLQFNGLWVSPTEGYAKRRYVFHLSGSDSDRLTGQLPWYVIVKVMNRYSRCQSEKPAPLVSVKVWHGRIQSVIESWTMVPWTKAVARAELKHVLGLVHAAGSIIAPGRRLSTKNHLRHDLQQIQTRAMMDTADLKAYDHGLAPETIKQAYSLFTDFIDANEEDDGPS